jgi:hypothetical protein
MSVFITQLFCLCLLFESTVRSSQFSVVVLYDSFEPLKYYYLSTISRIDTFFCCTAGQYLAVWYACGMYEGLFG